MLSLILDKGDDVSVSINGQKRSFSLDNNAGSSKAVYTSEYKVESGRTYDITLTAGRNTKFTLKASKIKTEVQNTPEARKNQELEAAGAGTDETLEAGIDPQSEIETEKEPEAEEVIVTEAEAEAENEIQDEQETETQEENEIINNIEETAVDSEAETVEGDAEELDPEAEFEEGETEELDPEAEFEEGETEELDPEAETEEGEAEELDPEAEFEEGETEELDPEAEAEEGETEELDPEAEAEEGETEELDPEAEAEEGETEELDPEAVSKEDKSVSFGIFYDGDESVYGEYAHFKAELTGYEGIDYKITWQNSKDREEWFDLDEHGEIMDVEITDETCSLYWRVKVEIVENKADNPEEKAEITEDTDG